MPDLNYTVFPALSATTLVDDFAPAGTHTLTLPDLPAGRYTLRLSALDATETTPLLIIP